MHAAVIFATLQYTGILKASDTHMRLQVLSTPARPSLGSSTVQTPLGCPTPPLCTPLHQASVKAVSGPSPATPSQRFSRPAPQVGLTIQLDGHQIILSLSQSKLAQLEGGQNHHRPGSEREWICMLCMSPALHLWGLPGYTQRSAAPAPILRQFSWFGPVAASSKSWLMVQAGCITKCVLKCNASQLYISVPFLCKPFLCEPYKLHSLQDG